MGNETDPAASAANDDDSTPSAPVSTRVLRPQTTRDDEKSGIVKPIVIATLVALALAFGTADSGLGVPLITFLLGSVALVLAFVQIVRGALDGSVDVPGVVLLLVGVLLFQTSNWAVPIALALVVAAWIFADRRSA